MSSEWSKLWGLSNLQNEMGQFLGSFVFFVLNAWCNKLMSSEWEYRETKNGWKAERLHKYPKQYTRDSSYSPSLGDKITLKQKGKSKLNPLTILSPLSWGTLLIIFKLSNSEYWLS